MLRNKYEYKVFYDEVQKIWSVPKIKPFHDENLTFGRIVFEEMRKRPNHICQISDSENIILTNDEARLIAIRIVRYFEKEGIEQSDVIGLLGLNTTYIFCVILACFFHGCAYHAVNPLYEKSIAKQVFNITKPKIIFCDGQFFENAKFATDNFKPKIFILKNQVKGVPMVLDLLTKTGDEDKYKPAILENGLKQNLAILCTSGSTGVPKAVPIPNKNHLWIFLNFFTQDDIIFQISTLDWLSATFTLIANLLYGATRIITDKPFSAEYFLEIVEKYKITSLVISPPLMASLTKCPKITPNKLYSIRYFLYGGCGCSLSVQNNMLKFLRNGELIFAYGFTEIGSAISRNLNFNEKPGSVGLILPGIKARVVNEQGDNLGPNEIGEVFFDNGEFWHGYVNNVEATLEARDSDGWFHSGDMGYIDDDGYLYIVERKKELLKYKLLHYYPGEIEEVILRIPDVREVCVFGIENDLEGDKAAAIVVKMEGSSLTANDVVNFVRKNIEVDYKQLHSGCFLVSDIPKTPNSKYDRKGAKKLFLEMCKKV